MSTGVKNSAEITFSQPASVRAAVARNIDPWIPYVGQIRYEADYFQGGSGLLIAPGFFMTCSHVIPDPITAQKSHVVFHNGMETYRADFDVDTFFWSSASPGNQPIKNASKLDVTIVALQWKNFGEELLKMNRASKSIFKHGVVGSSPQGMERVSIIHYPAIPGRVKEKIISYGVINLEARDAFNLCHYASVYVGSSGAPLFDRQGRLLGMHRGSQGEVKGYGTAVPIEKILMQLRPFQEKMEASISAFHQSFESTVKKCQQVALVTLFDPKRYYKIKSLDKWEYIFVGNLPDNYGNGYALCNTGKAVTPGRALFQFIPTSQPNAFQIKDVDHEEYLFVGNPVDKYGNGYVLGNRGKRVKDSRTIFQFIPLGEDRYKIRDLNREEYLFVGNPVDKYGNAYLLSNRGQQVDEERLVFEIKIKLLEKS